MYSHNMVGSNDLDASKTFYDATFQAIGGKPAIQDDKGRLLYVHNGGMFLVTAPIDGQPATAGNGCTIVIAMTNPEQAYAWHAEGVAAGGTAIEDPPGVREGNGMKMNLRSEEQPSELQSVMHNQYSV